MNGMPNPAVQGTLRIKRPLTLNVDVCSGQLSRHIQCMMSWPLWPKIEHPEKHSHAMSGTKPARNANFLQRGSA